MKEVAPSSELRKGFDQNSEKFEEFKRKYKQELQSEEDPLEKLKHIVIKEKKEVTLLYGAKDEQHNQAVVLKEILDWQQV